MTWQGIVSCLKRTHLAAVARALPGRAPHADVPSCRLVHDFRRSAAREFRKAGVSEGVVMRLCGWETRSMFDRYNIIDEADLAAAVAKRFNGKVTAKSEGFAEQPQ